MPWPRRWLRSRVQASDRWSSSLRSASSTRWTPWPTSGLGQVSEIPALHSARPEEFAGELRCPKGFEEIEWQVEQVRAAEAAARLLWPTGDLGLRKRLHRITADTLLVWGSGDRIVPASYAKRFADGISGETTIRSIEGAGHRVDFDAPEALAKTILDFTS